MDRFPLLDPDKVSRAARHFISQNVGRPSEFGVGLVVTVGLSDPRDLDNEAAAAPLY